MPVGQSFSKNEGEAIILLRTECRRSISFIIQKVTIKVSINNHGVINIMVDMNTKVGKEESIEIVSKYGVESCNKRYEKRLHKCIVNDKVITNT